MCRSDEFGVELRDLLVRYVHREYLCGKLCEAGERSDDTCRMLGVGWCIQKALFVGVGMQHSCSALVCHV
jgi:hypothetical protein